MNGPGMWMPKQKDGKNWELTFSATPINGGQIGDRIVNRRKAFRIRADAEEWIRLMKRQTVEAKQLKDPSLLNFHYSKISKILK